MSILEQLVFSILDLLINSNINHSEIAVVKLSKKTFCCNRGFSMVEVIVAMLVISITVLGTMSMQYHSALDTQRAEVNANAPRIAILLTEAWRGSSGRDTFDPITLFGSDLNIQADKGPPSPTGFLLLGNYKLNMEDVNYFITLSYQDINLNVNNALFPNKTR